MPSPLIAAVRDLLFRSRIDEAARRAGVAVLYAPRDRPLAEVVRAAGGGTLLADLGVPGALDALREAAAAAPVRVIGFLGHTEEHLAEAAAAAGIEVLTRGQLVARLDRILSEAARGAAGPAAAP